MLQYRRCGESNTNLSKGVKIHIIRISWFTVTYTFTLLYLSKIKKCSIFYIIINNAWEICVHFLRLNCKQIILSLIYLYGTSTILYNWSYQKIFIGCLPDLSKDSDKLHIYTRLYSRIKLYLKKNIIVSTINAIEREILCYIYFTI